MSLLFIAFCGAMDQPILSSRGIEQISDRDVLLKKLFKTIKDNRPADIITMLQDCPDLVNGCCNVGGNLNDCVSPLHIAAAFGRDKCITILLKYGADGATISAKGNTPLHCAHNAKCANLLILAGADIEVKNKEQHTPLWCSLLCKKDYHGRSKYCEEMEVAQALLARNATMLVRDLNGFTLLQKTVQRWNDQVVEFLLSNVPDTIEGDSYVAEAFDVAVQQYQKYGNVAQTILPAFEKRGLLFFPGMKPTFFFAKDYHQFEYLNYCARLFTAVKRRRKEPRLIKNATNHGILFNQCGCIAKYVSERDLDTFFTKDTTETLSELFIFLSNQALALITAGKVQEFENKLSNIPFVIKYDQSIVHKMVLKAIESDKTIFLKLLLKHTMADSKKLLGTWLDDDWGWKGNYVHYAVRFSNPKAIKLLAQYGVNCLHTDEEGDTPLDDAISLTDQPCIQALNKVLSEQFRVEYRKGNYKKAKNLLMQMTDANVKERTTGDTLVHYILEYLRDSQLKKFLALLKAKDANFNMRNNEQETPLLKALILATHSPNRSKGDKAVFEALLNTGARVRVKDKRNNSLLSLALIWKYFDGAELFLQHEAIVDNVDLQREMPQELKEKLQEVYDAQECCICFESADNLADIGCKNKHNELMCKNCFDGMKNKVCPLDYGELSEFDVTL